MKKFIAILLISIYATSAVGVTINYHYCGRQLAKVSFFNFAAHKGCSCDTNSKPGDCCKDELKYQKADTHNTIEALQVSHLQFFTPTSLTTVADLPFYNEVSLVFDSNDARRSPSRPVFLLNRVFRI